METQKQKQTTTTDNNNNNNNNKKRTKHGKMRVGQDTIASAWFCLWLAQLSYVIWFQACTEMVMPLCSDGVHDMFTESKVCHISARKHTLTHGEGWGGGGTVSNSSCKREKSSIFTTIKRINLCHIQLPVSWKSVSAESVSREKFFRKHG